MPKTKVRTDYDSPWKEIIERFFREFVQFFLPAAYAEINWSRPPEFLERSYGGW